MRNFIYISLIFIFFNAGCSSEKNAPINRAFHNTTSHYNAYFYAKENIEAIEKKIKDSVEPDYDNILPIFATFDTALASSYKEETEEAIKMASLSIQRHPISKWVDDSYLLVGLARLYDLDFVNAIKTFKYVYVKSKNNETKHLAGIYLLRTYTESGEYDNAIAVSDVLKKQKLNQSNKKLLNLHRAYYYQVRDDLDNMLQNLSRAAPDLNNNDGKGRMYFIIGQNYQELGFDAEAYNYYRKCLATNPEYELDFFARLKMTQVTQLTRNSDLKTVRKHFKILLKDKKNEEFKDKIYFEMAEFEAKQNNLDEAITFYNLSIRNSVKNKRQKGLGYLKLGKIYYDTLRNYTKAEAYYDSTIQVLPTNYEDYDLIKERQLILKDFVTQLNTIQLQDSLLTLAAMDSLELVQLLYNKVDEVEKAQIKLREKEAKNRRNNSYSRDNSSNVFASASTTGSNKWYFGNPAAVALGQTEFKRVWGDLTLGDDWRRSTKEAGLYNDKSELANNNNSEDAEEGASLEMTQADKDDRVKTMLGAIPFSKESKENAFIEIENAYYKLGNIYHFDLEEDPNAAKAYETLLSRFTDTEYKIEVCYLLYLIYKKLENERFELYKDILLSEYPKSTYSKLILNPNYTLESSIAEEKLKVEYAEAYALYQSGQYKEALLKIEDSLKEYDELSVSDKLKILKILIIGKTEDIALYQYSLSEFVKNNQESEMVAFAQTLLKASRDFQDRVNKAKGIEYKEYFEQEHYLILVHETKKNFTDDLTKEIDNFNSEKYSDKDYKTSNLILDDNNSLTMVSEFSGAQSSVIYYEKLIMDPSIKNNVKLNEMQIFVISKDNFSIFYQSKELKRYMRFFTKHYL